MVADSSSDQRQVIQASEILAKIERGEDVEYDGVIVVGDLDLSELDLPMVHVDRTEFETVAGLLTELKAISSTISITNSEICDNVNLGNAQFQKTISFAGTEFGKGAFFSGANFTSNADFWGAKFIGIADFEGTQLGKNAYFGDANFTSNAQFMWAYFGGYAGFVNAKFTETVDFVDAKFSGHSTYQEATFSGGANFFHAQFFEYASFINAKFTGNAEFDLVYFGKYTDFVNAKFAKDGNFASANFMGKADFGKAEVSKNFNFKGAEFIEDADFASAKFSGYANFMEAKFRGKADYKEAQFVENAYFWDAEFSDDVYLSGAKFGGDAYFSGAKFDKNLYISNLKFDRLYITWNSVRECLFYDGPAYLALIKNFRVIEQFSDADDCYYQYRKKSQAQKKWYREENRLIEYLVRCYDWTFTKFKQISEYFSWINDYPPFTWIHRFNWSKLLDWIGFVSCGYGVRIQPIILWVIGSVLGFTLLYKLLPQSYGGIAESGPSAVTMEAVSNSTLLFTFSSGDGAISPSWGECLYFSFTALTGGTPDGLHPVGLCKYAVMFEGVLGYLFLALFVVVLARKIIR